MVDMPDYAHPYMPNVLSNIQAVKGYQDLFNSQQTQQDVSQAGKIAATGDYDAASKYLMAHGHMDQAIQLQGMMRNAKADQVKDLADTHEKIGNLALLADTPEKWAQTLQVAQQHGLNTQGYEDFDTGRRIALAMSSKAKDFADQEKQKRDMELARLKGAVSYQTTIPGETETVPAVGAAGGWPVTPEITAPGAAQPATIMRTAAGEWTKPVAIPAGVDIENPISGAAGGGKEAAPIKAAHEIQADYKKAYGEDLPFAVANAASKSGANVVRGEDGKPQTVGMGGTMQGYRDVRAVIAKGTQDPELQREISEYRTIGKNDGALAQRKSIAGGAMNHLETVAQISDKDLSDTLGVIQGYGGYQKFLDAVKSGRVEESVAYHNAKQTLAVLLRETQNAYHIAGTGADTDQRLKETADALSPESFLQSPNIEVFRQRLNNVRAILQGVINSPRPSAFGSRAQATAGSAASEEEVKRVSGAPEAGGQVQRLQKHPHELSDEELKAQLGIH